MGSFFTVIRFAPGSTCSTLPRNGNSFLACCEAADEAIENKIRTSTAGCAARTPWSLVIMRTSFACGFLALGLEFHDFVVLIRRENPYQRHHARDKSAPAGRQSVCLGFLDLLVHRHHRPF